MPLITGCLVQPGLDSWLLMGLLCAILLFGEAVGLLILLRGVSKTLAILPLLTGLWGLGLGVWTQIHAVYAVHIGCGLEPDTPPFPVSLQALNDLEGYTVLLMASVFIACLLAMDFFRERKPRARPEEATESSGTN